MKQSGFEPSALNGGARLKIKSIDPTHLLVVLSPTETDSLGIHPETQWQNLHTRLTVAKIFAAACDRASFSAGHGEITIRISTSHDGETLLLFSTSPRRQYRIKGVAGPLIYRFRTIDDLLDAAKRLLCAGLTSKASLFSDRDTFCLIISPRYIRRVKTALLLGEYGTLCGKGRAAASLLREHGRLLSSNFLDALAPYFSTVR